MTSLAVFAGEDAVAAPATTTTTTQQKCSCGKPYKDVTKKSVGKDAYLAIKYIKSYHGFDKVVASKRFKPNKYITKREFLMILKNLYGEKYVPTTVADAWNANKTATSKWARKKLVEVSHRLRCSVTWDGSSYKLTRASAAQLIHVFCTYRDELNPKH